MARYNKGFEGNFNIRGAGIPIEWDEHKLSEFMKCEKEPLYFIQTYIKIRNVDKEDLVPFILRDYQHEMLEKMLNSRKVIVKLPRQSGKSILASAVILWYIIFNRNYSILIAAHNGAKANDLLGVVKAMYEELPDWLQHGVSEWNKGRIVLESGSRIKASTTSISSARGDTYNAVLLDEAAFIATHIAEEFFKSVFPTISSGKTTKIFITSCVTKDTFVVTEKGIQQIGDLINPSMPGIPNMGYQVAPYNVLGKDILREGTIMVNNGKAPIKHILTSSSSLKCTGSHKLWACKNGNYGWYKTEELVVGDYISIQYGMNVWGNDDTLSDIEEHNSQKRQRSPFEKPDVLTPDLAYFLGLFVAEGYHRFQYNSDGAVTGGQVIISSGDNILDVLNRTTKMKWTLEKDGVHYRCASTTLTHFLEQFGFKTGVKAPAKTIPQRIMRASKSVVASFLRGMFDGDGSAHANRDIVSYVSTSEQMIDQIRALLLNFGVLSRKYQTVSAPTKKVKVYSTHYTLEIGGESTKIFFQEIGFGLSRKQQYEQNCYISRGRRGNHTDIIPFAKTLLLNNGLKPTSQQRAEHLSRSALLHYSEQFPDIISPNIKWEKIRSIENVGIEEVYDFCLEDIPNDNFCHSVIYNGIIGHQTPKGMNHFHSMWDAAIKKKSDYETVEIKWNDVPGRDEAFRNAVISEFGQTYFDQEYGAEFIGSDNTLIKGVKLMMMASDVERPLHDNGKSRIFAHPEKGRHYAITVDVSEGLGQDYSVVMVFDITTLPYTVAAIYQDNEISPMVLPGVILDMARGYNEAMVLVESNFGQQVADILWQDLEYEHVIMTARGKNNTKKDVVTLSTKSLPGVNMNALNKRLGCNTIKTILEADRLVIKDAKTYDEFLRFAKKKTSYAAVSGNDDLVMCCVLFGWLIDQGYVRDSTDVDIRAELNRQAAEAIERDMLPFGFEYEEPAPVIHIKKGPVEESLEPFMNWDRFEKIAAPEIKGREDPVNISTLFAQMFNQGPKSS